MTTKNSIRPIAICIIQNGDKLLASRSRDSKKNEVFYRILGGGMEFGETSLGALKREFREELATDLENIKFKTVLENIFNYEGDRGHEIVFVFTGDLVDKSLYQKNNIKILDSKEGGFAFWEKTQDFKKGKLILYPEGILEYI